MDIIRKCAANTVQSSVRDRANRILSIFTEVDDVDNHQNQPTKDLTPPPPPEVDLLLDIEPPPPPAVQPDPALGGLEGLEVQSVTTGGDMFSGLSLSDTTQPANASNEHLAALLAPSPPSDPFIQGIAPLEAETQKVESLPQTPPPPPVVQAPPMMQQPIMQQPVMGFGMTYPVQPMMNPGPYFMQQMPQQGVLPPQGIDLIHEWLIEALFRASRCRWKR